MSPPREVVAPGLRAAAGGLDAILAAEPSMRHALLRLDGPTVIRDGGTGLVVGAYVPGAVATGGLADDLDALRMGTTSRTGGLMTISRTFGFLPRIAIRNDYCRVSGMARDGPVQHARLCGLAGPISAVLARLAPEIAARHRTTLRERIREEYRLPGGLFTTGVLNRNSRLRYHRDEGNFPGFWNAMLTLRRDLDGGELVVPQLGVAFPCEDGSLSMFDGISNWHGVAAYHMRGARSVRYTAVFYGMMQLWRCLGAREELERVRRVKTERAQAKAARVRRTGP